MGRRLLAVIGAIGTAATALVLGGEATALAATTVSVPATQPWTDTGINVSGSVTLTASGTISVNGPEYPLGPQGSAQGCIAGPSSFSGQWTANRFPCWSLIGRVGNGPTFEVGKGGTFTVPAGRLFLGVDDEVNQFYDNSGSWTVQVDNSNAVLDHAYTTNGTSTQSTVFPPGAPIWYVGWVNVTNGPAKMQMRWQATGPRSIFDDVNSNVVLNSGPIAAYSPGSIPTDAPAGTYTLTVTLVSNGKTTVKTSTFTVATWKYSAGNYAGRSGAVTVGSKLYEPDGPAYWNYCGPGASRVLISAWTSNVPDIYTLAKEEKTDPASGTMGQNMVVPVNNAIGSNYYSGQVAGTQTDFSNMIGRDVFDRHHPLITSLATRVGNKYLIGWGAYKDPKTGALKSANHIVTITGFDFTSPDVGYISYYETAGKGSGATTQGPQSIEYNLFWLLVQSNKWQLAGPPR